MEALLKEGLILWHAKNLPFEGLHELIFKGATCVTLFSMVLGMCNGHGDLNLSLDFCSEVP